MMDDVLDLIEVTYENDEEGNPKPKENPRTVFCQVSSVGRSEFYQAAQAGLHPEYVFSIANFKDYHGERFVRYMDWLGESHDLYVTRIYLVPNSDAVELTCEERIGDGD